MRVLLAEDHPRVAAAIAKRLRRHGAAVDVALDGDKALFLARVHPYDVVVLDRDLPQMRWDDLCRALNSEKPTTKILMLSAAGSTEDLIEGLAIGADDYLRKPFRFAELVARMQRPRPPRRRRPTANARPRRHRARPGAARRRARRARPRPHAQGVRRPARAHGRKRRGREQ